MRIQPFAAGDFGTNAYIIYDFRGSECILVDAPFPYDRILGFIGSNGLKPSSLLLTHGHFDHIFGIPALRKAYPETRILIASEDMHFLEDNAAESARMAAMMSPSAADAIRRLDRMPDDLIAYGDECEGFRIIRTPGHTAGSVCIYSEEESILFSGDTLFRYGIGRTDLGGNSSQLMSSLRELMALPGDTMVLPGHGMHTTIENERKGNPFL